MQEEIFGPILPVLTYEKLEDALSWINQRPKPLALYCFTENKKVKKTVLEMCRFGGGCINDTLIHLATSEMPFGGVGESGMGGYHGEAGFAEFTHKRSIVDKKTWMDFPIASAVYSKKLKLIRKFLYSIPYKDRHLQEIRYKEDREKKRGNQCEDNDHQSISGRRGRNHHQMPCADGGHQTI